MAKRLFQRKRRFLPVTSVASHNHPFVTAPSDVIVQALRFGLPLRWVQTTHYDTHPIKVVAEEL